MTRSALIGLWIVGVAWPWMQRNAEVLLIALAGVVALVYAGWIA